MIRFCWIWILFTCFTFFANGNEVIRINQLGYLPQGVKVAVFLSDQSLFFKQFKLVENLTGQVIYEGVPSLADASIWGQKSAYSLDFSSVVRPGGYHLEADRATSP